MWKINNETNKKIKKQFRAWKKDLVKDREKKRCYKQKHWIMFQSYKIISNE